MKSKASFADGEMNQYYALSDSDSQTPKEGTRREQDDR